VTLRDLCAAIYRFTRPRRAACACQELVPPKTASLPRCCAAPSLLPGLPSAVPSAKRGWRAWLPRKDRLAKPVALAGEHASGTLDYEGERDQLALQLDHFRVPCHEAARPPLPSRAAHSGPSNSGANS
jgi:hypothetical protein